MKQKILLVTFLVGALSPFFSCFEKRCSNFQYYDFNIAHVDLRNKIVTLSDSLVFQILIDDTKFMGFNQSNSILIPTASAMMDCDKGWDGMKYPITKIEITSCSDFSTDYPAGSLLNDIVTAYTWLEGNSYQYIPLNDLELSKRFQSRMHISPRPSLSQDHVLTFRLHKSNGEVISFESENIHWQ